MEEKFGGWHLWSANWQCLIFFCNLMTGVPAMTLSQLDVQWQQTPRTAVAESLSVPHSQQPHWPQCPETPPPLRTPTPPHHKSLLSLDPSLELVKYRLGSFYALHWYTDKYFCVHELEMSYEESYNIFKASLLFVSINWFLSWRESAMLNQIFRASIFLLLFHVE